jgi:hypothetical protein
MALDEFLYQQNEIFVAIALFGLLLGATELGFRRGRVIRSTLIPSRPDCSLVRSTKSSISI